MSDKITESAIENFAVELQWGRTRAMGLDRHNHQENTEKIVKLLLEKVLGSA